MPRGRVIVVYGSTEAEPIAHLDWDEADPADLEAMYAGKGLLVGRPVHRIELRILDNRWGETLPEMKAWEFAERAFARGAGRRDRGEWSPMCWAAT